LKDKELQKKNKHGQCYNENDPNYLYGNYVHRAMSSCIGRGGIIGNFFRWMETRRKPRFLISGPPGSGKTMLLAKSGLPYGFIYPESRLSGKHDMPGWFFSDNAVYIDIPGTLSAPQKWGPLVSALKKHRFGRRRAVDGLLFVIDLCDFLRMDQSGSNKLAVDMREQADILISATGYNVPVCFIFSKTDRIEGGREFLSDDNIYGRMPVLGALFSDDGPARPPADIFSECYQKICDAVSDLCLLKMVSTDNTEKNRALCRFLAGLRTAEGRIAAFFTEFFACSARVSPRLGGFFLTPAHSGRILGGIIPQAEFRIKKAQAGTPAYRFRSFCFYLLMTILCAAAVFGIAGSGLRDALHMRTLRGGLLSLLDDDPAIENQYMALERLRLSYDYLQGTVKSPGRLIFGTGKVCEKIRDAYIAASGQVMVAPAAKYLESSLTKPNQRRPGEMTAEEHRLLYNDLKTYLLLTGGSKVDADEIAGIAETFELSLKKSPGERYRSLHEQIVRGNINTVIKFAADGRYPNRADKNAVQAARLKLAAAPRAGVLYTSVMDKLHAQRRAVPIVQIIGVSELLRYGRDVSALYTREGWEQSVRAELINASKAQPKAGWVMGGAGVLADEAMLLGELVSLYSDDLSRRWLDFIRNVYVSLPADIPSIARDLERLSSRNSETGRMLRAACSLAMQSPDDLTLPQSPPVSVGAIKGQIASVSNKLRGNTSSLTHDIRDPFIDAGKTFGPLETFLSGGGFDGYTGAMSGLSESLRQCGERGAFASTFTSRGDDPIKISRDRLTKAYAAMPAPLSAALRRVLESPLDITAGILAGKISAEIEESWNAEVAAHFNAGLAPRNPFNRSGADLSWVDFEEFFKPGSGMLWAYQEKNLAGLIERTPKGWVRTPARSQSVRVSVNDDVISAYNRAEKVAAHFFRPDGAPKRPFNTFYPFIPAGTAARSPAQSNAEAMSSEMAMRGFSVPKKVLRD